MIRSSFLHSWGQLLHPTPFIFHFNRRTPGTVIYAYVHLCTRVWCLTLEIPLTGARQAPLSMGFSRQEHWSELPFPSPGYLPDPGIEPGSPVLETDDLPTEL